MGLEKVKKVMLCESANDSAGIPLKLQEKFKILLVVGAESDDEMQSGAGELQERQMSIQDSNSQFSTEL